MECADIVNRTMLVALGVGFGLGGLVVKLLEPVRGARPHPRKAARPIPDRLPRGSHTPHGAIPEPERGPGRAGAEIGPDRLRQLLERGPVTRRLPPDPLATDSVHGLGGEARQVEKPEESGKPRDGLPDRRQDLAGSRN